MSDPQFIPDQGSEFEASLRFLYGLRAFGAKLGLENTRQLARLAGNPHDRLRFIHVAGTNGKGSTCAMLESIYRTAGLRVGLYTSPHLSAFGERIQVNRNQIPHADVTRILNRFKPLLKSFPDDASPSFFELVTVLALQYFHEQQCDLVVWETGLGGRFDSTNIVTPHASLITSINLDHQNWLGTTIAEIAAEKAGIIKPFIPVLTSALHPEAVPVLRQTAQQLNAPFRQITPADTRQSLLAEIHLPLAGPHQRLNAALAVATVQTLSDQIPVSDAAIRAGLETVNWAGRNEIVQIRPGRTCLLDGAHNPDAMSSLAETLASQFPDQKPHLILGLFQDKAMEMICQIMAPLAKQICTVPIASERTADPAQVATLCSAAHPDATVLACPSLSAALAEASDSPLVVITGSLYLVGQARELLGLADPCAANERILNDWTRTAR